MQLLEGWKLVPTELTEEMNVAGIFAASQLLAASGKEGLDAKRREIYRAQLAAAPTPPTKNPWKEAVEFECTAVNVHFDESNPDETLMRLMNHYEYMEQEGPQS